MELSLVMSNVSDYKRRWTRDEDSDVGDQPPRRDLSANGGHLGESDLSSVRVISPPIIVYDRSITECCFESGPSCARGKRNIL